MSDLNITDAFTNALIAASIRHIDTSTDIAWPNYVFDPANKLAYLEYFFAPVESLTETKDSIGIEDTGFVQISIFVPMNDRVGKVVNYDRRMLEIKDDLKSAFKPSTKLENGGTTVSVDNVTFTSPSISDSWYQTAMTINYYTVC